MTPKYKEDIILDDVKNYVLATYNEHYNNDGTQLLDFWLDRGTASQTCIDMILKYAYRYGKKDGYNKKDLLKIIHYAIFVLYADHYRDQEEPEVVELDPKWLKDVVPQYIPQKGNIYSNTMLYEHSPRKLTDPLYSYIDSFGNTVFPNMIEEMGA